MSIFKNSGFDYFTSGGQLTIHNWRMFKQVMKVATQFLVVLFVILSGFNFWSNTSEYERHVMWKYNEAQMKLLFNDNALLQIKNPNGAEITATARDVANAPYSLDVVDYGIEVLIVGAASAGLWTGITFLAVAIIFAFIGKRMRAKEFRRGALLVKPKELIKLIRRYNRSKKSKGEYKLAGIPYPHEAEFQHTQLPGSTGKGKTVLFRELIQKARKNGDGGIIYCYTPDFVQEFYDPERDVLLNPFDQRCAPYSIFNDVHSRPHLDMIMEALIPDPPSGSDPFWNQGARKLAAESAWQIRQAYKRHATENGETTFHVPTQALTQRLLRTDLTELAEMIRNSAAAAIVDPDKPGTAVSLRAILTTYMDCLKYLPDQEAGFSVRNWMHNRKPGSFLFITTRADMHASLTPLISLWIDLATNALLSREENREEHFWFFIDEIPTLHKLPSLINSMATSRNFGGCFVLGYQGPFDLIERYGDAGAKRIWNLCNTRAILNMPDFDNAKWAANNFGKTENEETQISRTYGAHDVRDGVSQNQREELKELVLPSEIMHLPDLSGYLRFPKGFPTTKVTYKHFKLPTKNKGFIPLKDSDLLGTRVDIDMPPLQHELVETKEETQPPHKPEPKPEGTASAADTDAEKTKSGPTTDNVLPLFPDDKKKKSPEKQKEKPAENKQPSGSELENGEPEIEFDTT